MFDSGIKEPLIIGWPEKYRPAGVEPGDIDQRLLSFVDLAPTILSIAGVGVPNYMEGFNIADSALPGHEYVCAARDRIDDVYDRQRLFDLQADPYQLR